MKFDDTISNIVVDISRENNIDLEKTRSIVNGIFTTVRHVIENEPPGVIKLDYFGKFIYSSAWKRKMQDISDKIKQDEAISTK